MLFLNLVKITIFFFEFFRLEQYGYKNPLDLEIVPYAPMELSPGNYPIQNGSVP